MLQPLVAFYLHQKIPVSDILVQPHTAFETHAGYAETEAVVVCFQITGNPWCHSVQVQNYFGFSSPQAIYKWQRGESLPSIDNLIVLRKLFRIAIDKIVVCKGQGTACAVDRYALPEMPISYGEFKMDCDENGQFYLIFPWD